VLSLALKVVSPIFVLVGAVHLVLGLQADVLLGADLPTIVLTDPVLDSQNRFYGVAFSAYGIILYICAMDLYRYQSILRALLWVFFAAGCARIVSMTLHGIPSQLVLLLLATELILPPVCIVWLSRTIGAEKPDQEGI
jgi:hypothetical protein